MYIVDMLSRAFLKEQRYKEITPYQIFQLQHEEAIFSAIEDINFAEFLRVSEATQEQIKRPTHSDVSLQTLLATVLAVWPTTREAVPPCIRMYWGYREEITAQNGVL